MPTDQINELRKDPTFRSEKERVLSLKNEYGFTVSEFKKDEIIKEFITILKVPRFLLNENLT